MRRDDGHEQGIHCLACPKINNKNNTLVIFVVNFYPSLTAADAQDAGGSYFKHILLCTTSVAYGHWASLVSVSGTYGA